jgi:hypothetical protein
MRQARDTGTVFVRMAECAYDPPPVAAWGIAMATQSKRLGRSLVAIAAGFITFFVLSLATDNLLRVLHILPRLNEPVTQGSYLIMTLYRMLFAVGGCYLAARLAPSAPMRHALILGGIGLVLSLLELFAAIVMPTPGPLWYPALLVLAAVPCAWIGAKLYR